MVGVAVVSAGRVTPDVGVETLVPMTGIGGAIWGALVASVDRAGTGPAQVVRWMVGREIAEMAFDDHTIEGKALLRVEGLSLPSPPDSDVGSLARRSAKTRPR